MPDIETPNWKAKAEQGSDGADERARAETAARDAEKRYLALVSAIDQGFCTIEVTFDDDKRAVDYRFLEVSPSFERQTGIEDAAGRSMRDIAPDQDQFWFDTYGRVALTGESERFENFSTPLDRWWSVYAFKIEGPARIGVVFHDITDRKRAEAALRTSEQQFEALFNQAPLGVYLVDSDFVIRQVNPIALPVFGDIEGGPVGRDFDEVIHILWDSPYADEVVDIFRHTLETGEPFVTPERAEYRVDRDTTEYYEWRLDRIPLGSGHYGVVCYFRDISAQVNARKEIEKGRELGRESEERYRTLFKAIDSGFCIIEMIFGKDGRATDYRFVETNPAFERQSGLVNAVGHRILEFAPDLEEHWFERYGRVALTGESLHVEGEVAPLGRWFDINAFRVGALEERRVAVLFTDITARQNAEIAVRENEKRQAFLLKLSDALRAEPSAEAVANRAVRMLFEQMGLDRCFIGIYRLEEDRAEFRHQVHDDRLSPLPAEIRLSDFPEGLKVLLDRTLVIGNVAEDEGLSDGDRANIEALGVRALVNATLRKGKSNPLWAFVAGSTHPRAWTQSEVTLVEEVAERTWAAVERARAEAALHESEEKYRSLFGTIDEGFFIAEMIFDEAGAPVDILFVESNASFERLTRSKNAAGKTSSELFPNVELNWFETYARVLRTGESVRFENFYAALGCWFDLYASRIGGPGSNRLAVVFNDITERKNAENALRESEKRQAFLLKLSDTVRPLANPNEVQAAACRLLGEFLKVDRATYYEIDSDGVASTSHGYSTGAITLPDKIPIADFGQQWLDSYRKGANVVVNDIATDLRFSDHERAAWGAIDMNCALAIPLVKDGQFCAVLGLLTAQPRHWTDSEIALVEEVAERTWAAVERARAEVASKRAEARIQQLVALANVSGEFFGTCDMEFMPTFGNAAAMRLVGLADLDQVKRTPLQEFFFPEDLAFMTDEFFPRVLREGRGKTEIRFRHFVTGEAIWVVYDLVVLKDETGQAIGLGTVTHDITERKRTEAILRDSERHQGLLLAELQHRVRNILTMVRSVARRTAENCEDVDDYVRHLDGRLSSLARVQTILTRRAGRGANLYDLVLDELQMQTAPPEQYRIEGPEVELSPKAAEVLSLAVHELATNSIKYGVLSEPSGTIRIGWSVDDRDGQAWLRFTWNEPVGPQPDRPSRIGFGTDLIKNRVPYELHGTGDIRIGSNEVEAQIDFPLTNEESKHESVVAEKVMGR